MPINGKFLRRKLPTVVCIIAIVIFAITGCVKPVATSSPPVDSQKTTPQLRRNPVNPALVILQTIFWFWMWLMGIIVAHPEVAPLLITIMVAAVEAAKARVY